MNTINPFSIAKIKMCESIFNELKIPYALIKGDALSLQAYGNPGMRNYGDIDILLSRKHLPDIKNILSKNGFVASISDRERQITLATTSHQTTPWIKDIGEFGYLEIDMNTDVFWGEYSGERMNIDEFLSDTIHTQIYGIGVNILPPIKALIQLILHHYKDMNSIYLLSTRNSIRRYKFDDLYHLLCNNLETIKVDDFIRLCENYHILPYAYYMLYFTNHIYNDPVMKKYVDASYTIEGKKLLNMYGLNINEQHQWRVTFNERLDATNIFDMIKNDLTKSDFEKIKINNHIFGI